jgi:hypothetical protein
MKIFKIILVFVIAIMMFPSGLILIDYLVYKNYKIIGVNSEIYSELNICMEKRKDVPIYDSYLYIGEGRISYVSRRTRLFNSDVWLIGTAIGTLRVPKDSDVEKILYEELRKGNNIIDSLIKERK